MKTELLMAGFVETEEISRPFNLCDYVLVYANKLQPTHCHTLYSFTTLNMYTILLEKTIYLHDFKTIFLSSFFQDKKYCHNSHRL